MNNQTENIPEIQSPNPTENQREHLTENQAEDWMAKLGMRSIQFWTQVSPG